MATDTSKTTAYRHHRNVKGLTIKTKFSTGALNKRNGALEKPNGALEKPNGMENEAECEHEDEDIELKSPNTDIRALQKAWLAFVTAIRNVDDRPPDYVSSRPKPTLVSSGLFQQVMVAMYGNTEYSNTKGFTLLKKQVSNIAHASAHASQIMVNAVETGQQEREEKKLESRVIKENDDDHANNTTTCAKDTEKRGWKVLKQHINKLTNEKDMGSPTVNATELRHSVTLMSSGFRARQDLYERYGIVPTTLPDGSVVRENRMLSDRSRAQMCGRTEQGKQYSRPKSAMTSSTRTNGRLLQSPGRDMTNGTILKRATTKKLRPLTAH